MANTTYNKIIYGGQTLIDLTADTVDAAHLLSTYTAHDKSGAVITGACTYDSDTSDDTASVGEILETKTAHARGVQLTGTMPNRGGVTGTISTVAGTYTIQQGYHDGSGSVSIDLTERSKLIPSNIKSGVVLLGITGEYTGEAITAQAKTATPSTVQQVITPDANFDYLSQITILPIPYVESDNSAGGITVTIASA